MSEQLSNLEKTIAYKFKDKALLETALTHRSMGHGNNERLEYLGDAALNILVMLHWVSLSPIRYSRNFPRRQKANLPVSGRPWSKVRHWQDWGGIWIWATISSWDPGKGKVVAGAVIQFLRIRLKQSLVRFTLMPIWKSVENVLFPFISNYFRKCLRIHSIKIPRPPCRNYYSHEDWSYLSIA